MIKNIVAALLVIGYLAGCNTTEGAGRDLERGGEKIQGTAKDAKRQMAD